MKSAKEWEDKRDRRKKRGREKDYRSREYCRGAQRARMKEKERENRNRARH